jgi:hypothetical protein
MTKQRRCVTHGWLDHKYWTVGRDKYLRCSICGDMLTDDLREVQDE